MSTFFDTSLFEQFGLPDVVARCSWLLLQRGRQAHDVVDLALAQWPPTPFVECELVGQRAVVIFHLSHGGGQWLVTHITETSKSRLNERMSMLLDPMTATSSSMEKCLECRMYGAGYRQICTPASSSAS